MLPILLASTIATLGINAHLRAANGYLYVSEYTNGGMAIYALSDPASPRFVGRYVSSGHGNVRDLVPDPDNALVYLIVSDPSNVIDVVDVSNKTDPVSVGSFPLAPANFPKELIRVRDALYVVCISNEVQKWQIASPRVLIKVGQHVNNPNMVSIAAANALVFMGSLDGNVDTYDRVLTWQSGSQVKAGVTNVTSLGADGSLLYALTGDAVVSILDTSNPMALTVLHRLPAEPGAISLTISKDRLYVVCGNGVPSVLVTYDRSVPEYPVRLGITALRTGTAGFMAISGDYGYVTGHFAPLTIDTVYLGPGQ